MPPDAALSFWCALPDETRLAGSGASPRRDSHGLAEAYALLFYFHTFQGQERAAGEALEKAFRHESAVGGRNEARLLGMNLPIGGGGYFRLTPFELIRRGIQRVNARERKPVMFYLHPWELDAGQPRPPMLWHHRFRHYVGLEKEAAKLSRLLSLFRFGTARDVLLNGEWADQIVDAVHDRLPAA